MIKYIRTNYENEDFNKLVKELDLDLSFRDGDEHAFYAQLNNTGTIKHVIVAYDNGLPVGCGAIREYSKDIMEVKRMYVQLNMRGKGIATIILKELEKWALELNYIKCILVTGTNQPEAIQLYKKNKYVIIPNFGSFKNVKNIISFQKKLKE